MAFFVYRANHGTKAWYQIMGCLGGISSEQKGTKSRYQRTQITVAKQALRGMCRVPAIYLPLSLLSGLMRSYIFLLFYRETPVAKTAVTGHRMGWFCTNCTRFSQHLNAHSSNWKEVGAEWLKPNPTTGKGTMVRNSFLLAVLY